MAQRWNTPFPRRLGVANTHGVVVVGPQRSTWLDRRQMDGVLRLLEDCERAADLATFRLTALEGMARYLGYRHTTFFVGATPESCFTDRNATGHGIPERVIESHIETFHRDDLFPSRDGQPRQPRRCNSRCRRRR